MDRAVCLAGCLVWITVGAALAQEVSLPPSAVTTSDSVVPVPQDRFLDLFRSPAPDGFRESQWNEFRISCPDAQSIASCLSPVTTARLGAGSWIRLRVTPGHARVYINRTFVGTAEQFAGPYRGLRIGQGPQLLELKAAGYKGVTMLFMQGVDRVADVTHDLQPSKR